uniref:Reverse transcriptase domain-containing protein n=1 Tax=Schizaphis graminum TaxID=13262 RepID=A0A2S2PC31_SCHGA
MAESKDKLKEQSKKLINAAKRVGLEINAEKTEYMVVQRHEQIGCRNAVLEVENYKFKRVQQFKYLGTLITQQNEIDTEIKARIQAANKCYFGQTKLLRFRVISKNLKSQIYQTLIKSVVTYG